MYTCCIQLYFIALLLASPVNITFPAEYITDASFVVQWDAVSNHSVYRYIVNWTDGANLIQTVTVNTTSYNVTGLTPNTTYNVTVAGVNKYDCSGPPSAIRKVTTNISLSMDTASTTSAVISTKPTTVIATTPTITTTGPTTTDHINTTIDSTSSMFTTTTTILMATTISIATSSVTVNTTTVDVMPTVTNHTTTIDVLPSVTNPSNVTSKFFIS